MAQLRLFFRFALTVCVIASTQGLLLIQGAFHVNREAIAETYCVNKARPEMNCNGACELSRRMHEQHENERSKGTAVLDLALAVAATETASRDLSPPPATEESVSLSARLEGTRREDNSGSDPAYAMGVATRLVPTIFPDLRSGTRGDLGVGVNLMAPQGRSTACASRLRLGSRCTRVWMDPSWKRIS